MMMYLMMWFVCREEHGVSGVGAKKQMDVIFMNHLISEDK